MGIRAHPGNYRIEVIHKITKTNHNEQVPLRKTFNEPDMKYKDIVEKSEWTHCGTGDGRNFGLKEEEK